MGKCWSTALAGWSWLRLVAWCCSAWRRCFLHLLRALHLLWATAPFGLLLGGLAEDLGVLVEAALALGLLLLHHQRVRLCISVLADSGYEPRHLDVRGVSHDAE